MNTTAAGMAAYPAHDQIPHFMRADKTLSAASKFADAVGSNQMTRPAPSLQTALSDAHKNVSMLSEAIDMLEARIQPVMGPPSAAGTSGLRSDTESTSTAVSEANGLGIRLRELIARVHGITERVET